MIAKRIALGLVIAFAVQGTLAAYAQCTGNEKVKATCKDDDDRICAKVKNGEAGATVTVRFTSDDFVQEVPLTLDSKGKGKVCIKGEDDQKYTVEIVECGVSDTVKCDD